MPHATIGRWGKSLALRLPSEVAGEFRRHEGDRLNIESQPDQIVIRRSIDTLVRPVLCAGATISPSLADEVRARLAAFITL